MLAASLEVERSLVLKSGAQPLCENGISPEDRLPGEHGPYDENLTRVVDLEALS